jgi:murein L,D-transpeptidase YcbB/YkuD
MTPRFYSVAASVALALTMSACSGGKPVASDMSLDQEFANKTAALEAREAELKRREMALQNAPKAMAVSGGAASGSSLLPPQAEPGQCFTRVWQEPTYTMKSEQKLMSEAGEKIEVIPAKYKTGSKRIVVEEASTQLVTVPATYKTVTESVMVRPATSRIESVPAVYETVTERVIDKAAHTIWKQGTGPIQRLDESTGEIMCLVEVPATYKTISKQVIKTPASTRTVNIPAEYKTVTRRVVDQEAYTKQVTIPAKYSTVEVTEVVSPASERRVTIPAKYQTVQTRELVQDGEMAWREILCDTNTTAGKVREIQGALKAAGYNPGSVDGNLGPSTVNAVSAFQKSKGLSGNGVLTAKTVQALGLSLR